MPDRTTAWVICSESNRPYSVCLTKDLAMKLIGRLLTSQEWQGMRFSVIEVDLVEQGENWP